MITEIKKKEAQIAALQNQLDLGKARNYFAAKNKIKTLQRQLAELNTQYENEKSSII